MLRLSSRLLIASFMLCISTGVFSADNFSFFVMTDMHLDSYHYPDARSTIVNPVEGTYNSGDMQLNTFNKVFDKMAENNIQNKYSPNFILTLGDTNAHNSSKYSGYKQINLYTAFLKLENTFPGTPIFHVFGNNDSPEKNYGVFSTHGTSPYTTLMDKAGWKNGFLSNGSLCSDNADVTPCVTTPTEDNKKYGYFVGYLQKNLKLIALNSVLFSSSQYSPSHVGAEEELAWIEAELQNSMKNNENVILAMHIPMGSGWLDQYNDRFSKIMSKLKPGVIIGILAGHTHMDQLRITRLIDSNRKTLGVVPLIMVPALAPAHNNAPGFKQIIMTKNNNQWMIQDIVSFAFQQKTSSDELKLIEYYKFNDSYCPIEKLTVSECMNKNLGYGKSFAYIRTPASDLMNDHYTNGNLNYTKQVGAATWIYSYEVMTQPAL